MSDQSNTDSNTEQRQERRENRGGISSGGRRKVDRKPGTGRATKICFGVSLLVTFGIMAWTFSLPFRSNGSFAQNGGSVPEPDPRTGKAILRNPEYKMSSDEYRDYVMQFEDDLIGELESKNAVPTDLPTKADAVAYQAEVVDSLKRELRTLKRIEESEDGFDKKSIEWAAVTKIRKQLADKDQ